VARCDPIRSLWLDALVALGRNVRHLLEADARLDRDDVRGVCDELMAHFNRLHSSGEGEYPYLSELGRVRLTQTCLAQFAASVSKKIEGFYDLIQE
jgi:hypothetical protein